MPKTLRAARRPGHDLQRLRRRDAALLPLAGHLPDRRLPARHRRLLQPRRLPPAQGQVQHAAGLDAQRRLPHGLGRQVPAGVRQYVTNRYDTPPPGSTIWHATFEPRYYDYGIADNGERGQLRRSDPATTTRRVITDVTRPRRSRSRRSSTRPLYMTVNNLAPHTGGGSGGPLHRRRRPGAARRGRAFTRRAGAARRRRSTRRDVSDKPDFVPATSRSKPSRTEQLDLAYGCRLASLRARRPRASPTIYEAVDRAGELDNTVFVFTSDNGMLQGQHRLGGKNVPYEEGIHMPLVILAGSEVLGGSAGREQVPELTANVDLAPTILDLGRAKPCARPGNCRKLDGRSLVPLLRGGDPARLRRRPRDPDRGRQDAAATASTRRSATPRPESTSSTPSRPGRRLRSATPADRALRPDRQPDRRPPTRASSRTSTSPLVAGYDEPTGRASSPSGSTGACESCVAARGRLPLTPFGSWPSPPSSSALLRLAPLARARRQGLGVEAEVLVPVAVPVAGVVVARPLERLTTGRPPLSRSASSSASSPARNGSSSPASSQSRRSSYGLGSSPAIAITSLRSKSSSSSNAPSAVSPAVSQIAGEWPPTAQNRVRVEPGDVEGAEAAHRDPADRDPVGIDVEAVDDLRGSPRRARRRPRRRSRGRASRRSRRRTGRRRPAPGRASRRAPRTSARSR